MKYIWNYFIIFVRGLISLVQEFLIKMEGYVEILSDSFFLEISLINLMRSQFFGEFFFGPIRFYRDFVM